MSSLSVSGIPTSRVSELFVQQTLLEQMQSSQAAMLTTETQLSTGKELSAASQDPMAAMRIMSLQSLLDANAQMTANVTTNQSYLSTTDSALSNVSNLLTQAQSDALSVIGSSATDEQRGAVAQQIEQTVQELMSIGNQQFNGRYLFGGSDTTATPFTSVNGSIQYNGNNQTLTSFSDVNQQFATNVTGADAFSALSTPVSGTALNPAMTFDTPLSDLRQGAGISLGSIEISDGSGQPTIINLSQAKTIGDVATLIRDNPPAGRTLNVDITATGLNVQIVPAAGQPTALSIQNVGSDLTAQELGIAGTNTTTGAITGAALAPTLDTTTSLSDLGGTRATADVHSDDGTDSDFIVEAKTLGATAADGTSLNGVTVNLVDDPSVTAGHETVAYDPGQSGQPGTLTVHIQAGATQAYQVVNAINNANLPFQAELDPLNTGTGQGLVNVAATAVTQGGGGQALDLTSGMQIVNGGQTYDISLANCTTVQDVLNTLNSSGAGVLAEINPDKTGLEVQDRLSGSDFSIGENGGQTATDLGLRTFTASTPLADLNHGAGVNTYAGDPANGIPANDFTITVADGSQYNISVAGLTTAGQVIDQIDNDCAGKVWAQLATTGNGIQLFDESGAVGNITVTSNSMSTAASDLGLVPSGQTSASAMGVLTGSDVNPQETAGVFNALVRLSQALTSNNMTEAQRDLSQLSQSMQSLSFCQASLGAQEQGLAATKTQLTTENTQLQTDMSNVADADMATVISTLTSQQVAFQASLEATGQIFKMTLLNYI